ncbi:hypothetical protein FP744_10004486 [Trichoderma asperellum]|nr:hypothetical protein LI328DRAFT_150846 [Trichoderma asperelloides]
MFVKSSSALWLLLGASKLASSSLTAQIGYFAGLVPGLPGPDPGIGCGLFAQVTDGSDTEPATFVTSGGEPTDGCPAAEQALFCERWGCPFDMTFDGVVAVTVDSDNSGDKSISVTATGLNGPTTTVSCPWTEETLSSSDSGSLYSTWSCDLSALQK